MSLLWFLFFVFIAVVISRKLRQVDRLAKVVASLSARLEHLESRGVERNAEAAGPAEHPTPVLDRPTSDRPADLSATPPVGSGPGEPLHAADESPPRIPSQQPEPARRGDWERKLAENWFVWTGGITLALGAIFLVKFSLDYGLLTPALRVSLGLLLGIAFIIVAGRINQANRLHAVFQSNAVHVPPSLAAAGCATIFASLYSAYALYNLIPPGFAFVGLAATAVVAALLSLRHGPFVAGLGLLGAFAVPLLVTSSHPDALTLFCYLTVISAGALLLLRFKKWPWLAWVSLVGAVGWAFIWLATAPGPKDAGVLTGFLFIQITLYAAFRRGLPAPAILCGVIDEPLVRSIVRTAFWSVGGTMLIVTAVNAFQNGPVVTLFAAAAFLLWFAFRDDALDDVIAVAGFLVLGLVAVWGAPLAAAHADARVVNLTDDVARFVTTSLAGACLLSISGFSALRHVAKPARWASMSAAALPLLLTLAYWRLQHIIADPAWAALSISAAIVELLAVERLSRHRHTPAGSDAVLGAYAVGVTACTILACVVVLQNAWLTVAIALHLPAIAWINDRFRLPMLRTTALILAGTTLVRLAANPQIVHYNLSDTPVFNWLLYGYGVPTAAFVAARWKFAQDKMDTLIEALEACAIVFFFLLVTFETHHLMRHGTVNFTPIGFRENAVQALIWLGVSALLFHLGIRYRRRILRYGGIAILGLGTFTALVSAVLFQNPLFTHVPVGETTLFNYLAVAYGGPALFFGALTLLRAVPQSVLVAARGLTIGFAFLWITMEVRHVFQGSYLDTGHTSQNEWYAYSAAWLVFASACLGFGVRFHLSWLRRSGLAGIGLVTAKVFLFDMAALGGILRVLSFMGLGSVLIAIGYFYRRLELARSGDGPGTIS
jgi:uncharacterized membrane protein